MRCSSHNAVCTMVCQIKDCPNRLLCNQCMIRHNPTHYNMIQSINDIDYQISQVPELIQRDLDKLKIKLYQIQNHIVLEKEDIKKQILKLTEILKSRISTEIDEFASASLEYTNSYYKQFEVDISSITSVIADHLHQITPYASRVRPLNENQFQILMDFQDNMLTHIMPSLNNKTELLSKQTFENPLHIKVDHFYGIVQTQLKKALRPFNLFHNNEMQIEQKKMLELKPEPIHLARSSILTNTNINDDYKNQARELFRNHYQYSTKNTNRQEDETTRRSLFNLPQIKSTPQVNSYPSIPDFYNNKKFINTILTGHTDIVTCICIFTQTQIISGAGGGSIRIWDLESGLTLGEMNEHAGDVWALAKINDIHFASASSDCTVRIWSFQRMICESILVGHVEPIRSLIYFKDLDYLASGSQDMSIKLWAAGRAKLKMTIQESQKIKCLCYIEIKGLLLSGGNGRIKVFNVLNGYCKDQLEGHQGEVSALHHLQDTMLGEQISIVASGGSDQKIIIWNVDKGMKISILTGHQDTINGIAYDIKNNQLWSVGSDRSVRVWDLVRNKLLLSVKKHSELISCIIFMDKRELIITGSWDHRIRVISRMAYFS